MFTHWIVVRRKNWDYYIPVRPMKDGRPKLQVDLLLVISEHELKRDYNVETIIRVDDENTLKNPRIEYDPYKLVSLITERH